MQLYQVDRHDLKEPQFVPATPAALRIETYDGNLFAAIRKEDILLHHPYEFIHPRQWIF